MHRIPNFSTASEHIMDLAIQESRLQQHHFIGTEHIFNALCKAEDKVVLDTLACANIDPLIRRQIREALISGTSDVSVDQMIFTPRVNRLLKKSQELARVGGVAIEPIHLLVGLLQAGDGVAVRLLRHLNYSFEALLEAAQKAITNTSLQSGSNTPFLNTLVRDLTFLARQKLLDPVIGRSAEIQLMAETLLRKKKNNVLLVGDAGVGKTSLVEGLAMILTRDDAPQTLKNKRILEISTASIVAGTKYRGDLEQRVQRLLTEAKGQDIVLFIDEFHTIMSTGSTEGASDTANMLKPHLASGQIRVIGATTWKEYRSFIEPDAAFERRFQVIDVKELDPEDTLKVLQHLQSIYEQHHQVRITSGALELAVDLAVRFMPERRFPDKAIDLIDQACATLRMQRLSEKSAPSQVEGSPLGTVDRHEVAQVAAKWLGVPLEKILPQEEDRFLHLEKMLQERILGQSEAIAAVAATLRLAHAGLSHLERPRAVFFFVGPTGVGKTELARALAEVALPGRKSLVRLDMSEFMEQHTVAKLIGAPPGYIGYGDEGQLSGPLRRNSHVVVLFDEIDKAHPEILNLLLQVLDAGQLTDGKGRRVNFKESIIVFTSNIFSQGEKKTIGFAEVPMSTREADAAGMEAELRTRFRPEFINRLDKIILFHLLTPEVCREITRKELQDLTVRLIGRGSSLEFDDTVFEVILAESNFRVYGAREIRRAVNRLLGEPISQLLLKNVGPVNIRITCDLGKIEISEHAAPSTAS